MTPQEDISHEQALKDLEKINHRIAYEKAAGMVETFRNYVESLTPKTGSDARPTVPSFLTFHRNTIQEILDKPGCVGLRMYPAINENKSFTMVLVGVDGEGENLVVKPTAPDATAAKTASAQSVSAVSAPSGSYDEGQQGPPYPKPKNGF